MQKNGNPGFPRLAIMFFQPTPENKREPQYSIHLFHSNAYLLSEFG